MKTKKKVVSGVVFFLILAVVVLSVTSAIIDTKFWSITISQSLTLIVAIVIAFGAVQFLNDERKVKEQAERIIDKIQTIVTNTSFYVFKGTGSIDQVTRENRMACRKLSNCIDLLKDEYAGCFNFQEEADYIYYEYKQYNELVSEHITDLEYLSKSENILRKHAENINSKCDRVLAKIYK